MDVGIVFGVDSFEFRVDGGIAGAGQARIAFIDLDERVSDMEVGEARTLYESPEWFRITEMFCS